MSTGSAAPAGTTTLAAHVCWALLRDSEVGRLAVVVDARPDIFPVNFVVDRGTLVVRTGPGTKLAAAVDGTSVAFEVDGYDPAAGEAWSVVVKGRVELVRTVQQAVDTVGLPLFPWHAAPKPCFVRIVADEVTGRRFGVVDPRHWDRARPTGPA
jgi:nitroimidazol reductase NimA-like FMN-containing flavoprotein (pyridoxamine 5'-phosphate oxidase superfamily)